MSSGMRHAAHVSGWEIAPIGSVRPVVWLRRPARNSSRYGSEVAAFTRVTPIGSSLLPRASPTSSCRTVRREGGREPRAICAAIASPMSWATSSAVEGGWASSSILRMHSSVASTSTAGRASGSVAMLVGRGARSACHGTDRLVASSAMCAIVVVEAPPVRLRRGVARVSCSAQQRLYFFPEPHGHGSFLPTVMREYARTHPVRQSTASEGVDGNSTVQLTTRNSALLDA